MRSSRSNQSNRRFVGNDPGVFDGRRRGQMYRLPVEAPFPEKTAWLQDHDDGFFPLRRHHGQLDFARLNIEHGIRRILLRKEHLLLRGRQRRFGIADLGEEVLRIKSCHRCDSHGPHVSV